MEDYMKFIQSQAQNIRSGLTPEEQDARRKHSRRSNAKQIISNDLLGQPFRTNNVKLRQLLPDYIPN